MKLPDHHPSGSRHRYKTQAAFETGNSNFDQCEESPSHSHLHLNSAGCSSETGGCRCRVCHSLDSCGLLVATEHRLISQPLQTPAAPIKSSGGARSQMIGSASRGFTGCVQSGSGDKMLHFGPLSRLCELNVVFWTVWGIDSPSLLGCWQFHLRSSNLTVGRLEVAFHACTVLLSLYCPLSELMTPLTFTL